MTGTLSQIITLVSYGNDFLWHGNLPADFYPGNAAFVQCNRVDFLQFKSSLFSSKHKEILVAENPVDWFNFLKKDKCTKLRLFYQPTKNQASAPDHKMAGFTGGGGSWYMEAVYNNYSNYWASRWEVTDKEAANNRTWSVSYGQTSSKQASNSVPAFVLSARNTLIESLSEIITFCEEFKLNKWTPVFENAREQVYNPTPGTTFPNPAWVAHGIHSHTALQLLYAADAAWVFGDKGSWNDQVFEDKEVNGRFERLSALLYNAINGAIMAAVNNDQPKI